MTEAPLDFWAEWRKKRLEKNEGRREHAKERGGKLELGGCRRVAKTLRLACTEI